MGLPLSVVLDGGGGMTWETWLVLTRLTTVKTPYHSNLANGF
jgi:hypothetical protein